MIVSLLEEAIEFGVLAFSASEVGRHVPCSGAVRILEFWRIHNGLAPLLN
jgi:hypothetical protein